MHTDTITTANVWPHKEEGFSDIGFCSASVECQKLASYLSQSTKLRTCTVLGKALIVDALREALLLPVAADAGCAHMVNLMVCIATCPTQRRCDDLKRFPSEALGCPSLSADVTVALHRSYSY